MQTRSYKRRREENKESRDDKSCNLLALPSVLLVKVLSFLKATNTQVHYQRHTGNYNTCPCPLTELLPGEAALALFAATCRELHTISDPEQRAKWWAQHLATLSSLFAIDSDCEDEDQELPLEFVDPRLKHSWAVLAPVVKFAQLRGHITCVYNKILVEVRSGVADAKAYFQHMLVANLCNKHDPASFTDKIMEDTLCDFLEERFRDGGCTVIDVNDVLTNGIGHFRYCDTAPRDTIFDELCPRLGYVEKIHQEYGGDNWDFVGIGNVSWKGRFAYKTGTKLPFGLE